MKLYRYEENGEKEKERIDRADADMLLCAQRVTLTFMITMK